MQKQDILLGAGMVASFAAGFGVGYFVLNKKFQTKFDQLLEQEIEDTKAFYRDMNHKTGDFATPEGAAEALGVVDDAAEALVKYNYVNIAVKPEDLEDPGSILIAPPIEEVREEMRNIFAESAEMEELAVASLRDPEKPYIITSEEFAVNDPEYDQISVTYFEGDGVVADDGGGHIPDDDRCIGLGNLQKFDEQEDTLTLYVRNERMKTDFEVSRHEGKFSEEVLGFQHSDDMYMRSRRKQRLSDD